MKYCDTCGGEIPEAHPFRTCPQCLFAAALSHRDRPGTSEVFSADSASVIAHPHLFIRRDFFQKYDLLERVAQGGQGDVWKVWDFELRRSVAMKRLEISAAVSGPAVYRFLAEAQIASQLEHPGILPVFDVGLDPDRRPFYTTQLVTGTTFRDLLLKAQSEAKQRRANTQALDVLRQVCEIVAHAHSRGVLHRDLKPSNVLVGAFADVRVIDWGSAHIREEARNGFEEPFVAFNPRPIETDRAAAIAGEAQSPLATVRAGQPLTMLYTPPEALAGPQEEPGPETDIYSVGVMLYELLAGVAPYSGPDGKLPEREELRQRILRGPPTPVRNLNPAASRDVAAISQKAMAHQKAGRYRSMQELGADLRAVLEVRPVLARRLGPASRLQKWAQRNVSLVLLGCVALTVTAIALVVTQGLESQRDAARQMTALRTAELAARSGQWRQALQYWDEAEAAGYSDSIGLALHRAEAWTVLDEPARAQALLLKLTRRADLGSRRGGVLLQLGEHELFDAATAKQGIEHVRQAQAEGLTAPDELLAKGLLAQSATEALDCFQQALRVDPYHHGAHVQSLGFQFLLGREQELSAHARIFKVLYPEDPSPDMLEAAGLALQGRVEEARARLSEARHAEHARLWKEQDWVLLKLSAAGEYYRVETLLNSWGKTNGAPPAVLSMEFSTVFSGNVINQPGLALSLRLPHLPCVRDGLLEGNASVQSLTIPFVSDVASAVRRIKASLQCYPEALVPLMAGIILQQRTPPQGAGRLPLMQTEAELFQLAAECPSVMPRLPPLARFLAAKTEFELAGARQTNSPAMRLACLGQLRRAVEFAGTSVDECRVYFDYAVGLNDYGLAQELLDRWQKQQPGEEALARRQIQLAITVGEFSRALNLADAWLSRHPADEWARSERQTAIQRLAALLKSVRLPPTTATSNPDANYAK